MTPQRNQDPLEQMLSDARKVQQDRERSERLSTLIDQLAEAEQRAATAKSRPSRWRQVGIAASLLIAGALGLWLLHPDAATPPAGSLTAQQRAAPTAAPTAPQQANGTDSTAPISIPATLHAQPKQLSPNPQKTPQPLRADEPLPLPQPVEAEPTLMAEATPSADEATTGGSGLHEEPSQPSDTHLQVYVRHSNRLVGLANSSTPSSNPAYQRTRSLRNIVRFKPQGTGTEWSLASAEL